MNKNGFAITDFLKYHVLFTLMRKLLRDFLYNDIKLCWQGVNIYRLIARSSMFTYFRKKITVISDPLVCHRKLLFTLLLMFFFKQVCKSRNSWVLRKYLR